MRQPGIVISMFCFCERRKRIGDELTVCNEKSNDCSLCVAQRCSLMQACSHATKRCSSLPSFADKPPLRGPTRKATLVHYQKAGSDGIPYHDLESFLSHGTHRSRRRAEDTSARSILLLSTLRDTPIRLPQEVRRKSAYQVGLSRSSIEDEPTISDAFET